MKTISRHIALTLLLACLSLSSYAQGSIVKDFKPVCDSLNTLVMERQGIANPKLSLNADRKSVV